MVHSETERLVEYRVVLIVQATGQVLTNSENGAIELPTITLPRDRRPADEFNKLAMTMWGFKTFVIDLFTGLADCSNLVVAELLVDHGGTLNGWSPVRISEITEGSLTRDEKEMVRAIVSGDAMERGYFSRIGWREELFERVNRVVSGDGLALNGDFTQLNANGCFSLIRFATDNGRAMWFKSVGAPCLHEFALTVELSRLFPDRLPQLICTFDDVNGWLAAEFEGIPLDEARSSVLELATFEELSKMQEASIRHKERLLSLGAKDWTLRRISGLIEPFFTSMEEVMAAQTSQRSKPLSSQELIHLKEDIGAAISELSTSGIPDTLVHGDIGHGNTLVSSQGPVFLDWAETYIGNPFVACELLIAGLDRTNQMDGGRKLQLREHYSSTWSKYTTPGGLRLNRVYSPMLAALNSVLASWDYANTLPDSRFAWPMFRTLVRRTKTELNNIREARV